jgi:hypothetical protein
MNNIISGLTTPTTKKPYYTHVGSTTHNLTHNNSSAANNDIEASELSP